MSDETIHPPPTEGSQTQPTPDEPVVSDPEASAPDVSSEPGRAAGPGDVVPLEDAPALMDDGKPDPPRRPDGARAAAGHAAYVVDRNRRRLIFVGAAILLAFALFGVSAVV